MSFFDKLDQLAGITPGTSFGGALDQLTGNVQQSAMPAVTNAPVTQNPQQLGTGQAGAQAAISGGQYQVPQFAMPAPAPTAQMGPTQAAAMGQQPNNPLNQPMGPVQPSMGNAGRGVQGGPTLQQLQAAQAPVAPVAPQQTNVMPVAAQPAPGGARAMSIPNAIAPQPGTYNDYANPQQLNGQTTNEVTPQDLLSGHIFNTMLNAESGNRDYNANGTPVTSPAGAMFASQVMPKTAHNPGFGIRPAQNDSPEEYNRVGREYHEAMRKKYADEEKAVAAYNAGPGRVDRAIKLAEQNGGDWKQYLPAETQQYLAKVNPNAVAQQLANNPNQMGPSAELAKTGNASHDALIEAGNDPTKLNMIAFDTTGKYDEATRKGASQALYEMLDHANGMDRVKKEVQASAQNGNMIPVLNKMNQKTPEGSRFRAMLYELAGAKQAAADEYNKLGVGSSWQPGMMMSPEGKMQRYAVYMSPDGEAKRAIDSATGQEVTDPKVLQSLNGGGMGIGLKSAGLRQGMSTGNTYEVLNDKNGNTWYKNTKTGEMSPTLSENLGNVGSKNLTKLEAEAQLKNKNKFIADQVKIASQVGWNHTTYGSEAAMRKAADEQFGADHFLSEAHANAAETPSIPVAPGEVKTETATTSAVRPVDTNDRIDKYVLDMLHGDAGRPGFGKSGFNTAEKSAIERRLPELESLTGLKFDPNLYTNRQALNKEYTKVTPNSAGGIMQQANRAIPHMDEYAEAASRVDNTQNQIWNKYKNEFKTITGGVPASDVDALRGVVGAEVEKAIGGGKGVQERLAFEKEFDAARKTPQQLRSIIQKYQGLIAEQLSGLKQNWVANKLPEEDFNNKMVPRVREVFEQQEKHQKNTRKNW